MTVKTLFTSGIILFAVFSAGFWILKSRENLDMFVRRKTIMLLVIAAVILAHPLPSGKISIANASGILEENRQYVIKVNETQSNSGTSIKLKEVFADLLYLDFSYSIWGKEKLVAIELKKSLGDAEAISEITGLWQGGSIFPFEGLIGASYKSDTFIDPIFIVFYLSDGKNISFKINDTKGVRSKVKVIEAKRSVKYGKNHIRFTKIFKGLNYSSLGLEADFMPSEVEMTITDGNNIINVKPSWSGSGDKYSGGVWFAPIKSAMLNIKINGHGEEAVIQLQI